MIIKKKLSEILPLSQEAINRIDKSFDHPITYDKDCPQYNEEELDEMIRLARLEKQVAMDFAKRRKDMNMTQKQLADLVGTKQSNIARFESGTYSPTISFLDKIARALGTNIKIAIT